MAKTRARNKIVTTGTTTEVPDQIIEDSIETEVIDDAETENSEIPAGDLLPNQPINSGIDPPATVGQLLNLTGLLDKPVTSTVQPELDHDIPSNSLPPHTDLGIGINKTWSSVAKPKPGMSLYYCDKRAESTVIEVEEDDVVEELKFWKNTLMGNFLGAKPKIKEVDEYVQKYWKNVTRPIVQYYKKGWYSFRFLSEADMNEILKGGPWNMGTSTLVLKQWTPMFSKEMDSVSIVPAWILFPDLDPFMWSNKVLSKMASVVGKPLFADLPTTYKSKLSFARVLVEVDVAGDLHTTMQLNSPNRGETTQRIIYEWLPHYCHCCRKLGHVTEKCKFTKINNKLDEIRKTKVTQTYKPVLNKDKPISEVSTDCIVLGPAPSKLGDEFPTETVEKGSECPGGLGSHSVVLETNEEMEILSPLEATQAEEPPDPGQ
ncbi:uncharacterized protein LOC141594996 [Silene latifolia]|uniref:uncharacterized protein LOC141594996 n=1 Tax=Silene latifolia TaxID=37657 RepID=UPI003D76B609